MKKKLLFLLFLIGFFFYIPNVFADSFSVCRDGCSYSTLDDALTAAENVSDSNNTSYIYLYDYDTFTVSNNHNLNSFVYIYTTNNSNVTIDGGGFTINTVGMVIYGSNYYYSGYTNNLHLNNINLRTSGTLDNLAVLGLYSFNQVNVSNVEVKITSQNSPYSTGFEIYNYGTSTLDSVKVDGFVYGVRGNVTIKNSDLTGSLFSINADGSTIKLENTKTSYIYSNNGNVKLDLDDGRKIIIEDTLYINSEQQYYEFLSRFGRLYQNGDYEENLRIATYGSLNGTIKKTTDIGSPNSTIDLLDAFFGDDSYSLSDFDIDISNDEVLTIENGTIKPLRNGKCVITLVEKATDMEYRLTINVSGFETPKTNPKTNNSVLVVVLVLFLMITSLGSFFMKKRHE